MSENRKLPIQLNNPPKSIAERYREVTREARLAKHAVVGSAIGSGYLTFVALKSSENLPSNPIFATVFGAAIGTGAAIALRPEAEGNVFAAVRRHAKAARISKTTTINPAVEIAHRANNQSGDPLVEEMERKVLKSVTPDISLRSRARLAVTSAAANFGASGAVTFFNDAKNGLDGHFNATPVAAFAASALIGAAGIVSSYRSNQATSNRAVGALHALDGQTAHSPRIQTDKPAIMRRPQ